MDTPGIEPGTARNSQTVLSGRDKPTTPCALENTLSLNRNIARVHENYTFSVFFFFKPGTQAILKRLNFRHFMALALCFRTGRACANASRYYIPIYHRNITTSVVRYNGEFFFVIGTFVLTIPI